MRRYIDAGIREGAHVVFGETRDLQEQPSGGNFVSPTLFTKVDPTMTIAREEIFGPVGVVIPFRDAAHAVKIANDSIYGLAAGIWTSNLTVAHRFARDVEAGIVWVNCYDHGDMTQPWVDTSSRATVVTMFRGHSGPHTNQVRLDQPGLGTRGTVCESRFGVLPSSRR